MEVVHKELRLVLIRQPQAEERAFICLMIGYL